MKYKGIRISVPAGTLPTAPLLVSFDLPGAVVKSVIASQNSSASDADKTGILLDSFGITVYPEKGKGLTPGEDSFAPVFLGPLSMDISETISGPPYTINARFFNLAAGAIIITLLIGTEGKKPNRGIEKIVPEDNTHNEVAP